MSLLHIRPVWPCLHPKQRRKRVLVVIHWCIIARCYRLFWVTWYEIGRVLGNTTFPCRYLLYDFSVARMWQSQQSAVSFQFLSSLIIYNEISKHKLILLNPVSLKYREINKISYESKINKISNWALYLRIWTETWIQSVSYTHLTLPTNREV